MGSFSTTRFISKIFKFAECQSIIMIYRVRAEQGLLVLNFDAEGYYAVDDHMNALDAYGEKGKLYVKVGSPTNTFIYLSLKRKDTLRMMFLWGIVVRCPQFRG